MTALDSTAMTLQQSAPIAEIAKRFLRHRFRDIAFDYGGLTPEEQAFCTRADFTALVAWLHRTV